MEKQLYPYQSAFEKHLQKEGLADTTINEYQISLIDLFNYLSNFNLGYQNDHRVSQLFDRDIENYLQMLVNNREIADLTYNKVLSHLNVYFKFLFQNNWNQNLPTLSIKGKGRATTKPITTKWLDTLPDLLLNSDLHYYTRLTLLLISHGYGEKEFLQPNFYRVFNSISWQPFEKEFIKNFMQFLKPVQIKQQSSDIFLKQRFSNDPHITLPGLHKYLRPDQEILGFSLSPSRLLQSYMIHFITTHNDWSVSKLSDKLNLEPASILYYQSLLQRHLLN